MRRLALAALLALLPEAAWAACAASIAAKDGTGAAFTLDSNTGAGGNCAFSSVLVAGGALVSLTNALPVQPGTGATFPVSAASLPLPTGAATSAKQPALGIAGTASADVITVQGIAAMTPLLVDGSATTQPVSGSVTANAGTNLNTSLLALEGGGNLATLAGGVTASVYQSNLKQVNGVTTSTGTGAVGTGTQRVAVGTDTATIAGSAPGTAGTASSNVVTVQGIASMTAVKVDGSAVTQPVSGTVTANPAAATTGGATPVHYLSAASTNATNVKASAGTVYSITAINTTATLYYLKFYNKASSPTCNSDTVVLTYPVPASATGAGLTINPAVGIDFGTGISFCLTGGLADNDNTNAATGVAISLAYK